MKQGFWIALIKQATTWLQFCHPKGPCTTLHPAVTQPGEDPSLSLTHAASAIQVNASYDFSPKKNTEQNKIWPIIKPG